MLSLSSAASFGSRKYDSNRAVAAAKIDRRLNAGCDSVLHLCTLKIRSIEDSRVHNKNLSKNKICNSH